MITDPGANPTISLPLPCLRWSAVSALSLAFAFASGMPEGRAQPPETGFQSPDLPPVLRFVDGTPVASKSDWERRRAEIRSLWQEVYLGAPPETPPALLAHRVLRESLDNGTRTVDIELTFDTPDPLRFNIQTRCDPATPEPRPVLLTQPRDYQFDWVREAVRRGYLAVLYPGLDTHHHEPDFPGYESVWKTARAAFPRASWSSSLGIQAWLASRTVDFLLHPDSPLVIHPDQIGVIGHSRYGKQSLYAAAFDPRITAVVARSAGSPAVAGYRFTGRHTFMETPADFPDAWGPPSLRRFFGREDRLPVEGNGLLALIAPRPALIHTAFNDGSDPTFAVERAFLSAREAYRFLGAGDRLALLYREGNHNPITEDHVRANLDWFDLAFGRGSATRAAFQERLLHDFDWEGWRSRQDPADLVPPAPGTPWRDGLDWVLGNPAPRHDTPLRLRSPETPGVAVWSRDRWKPGGVLRTPVAFGDGVHGNLMHPADPESPLPVVIWLHPWNYSHGYNEGYGVEGTAVYYRLAAAGFAVLAYDQIGFGDRLLEGGTAFYTRHPAASLWGRMLRDLSDAVGFVQQPATGLSDGRLPNLDPDRIFLLGYSMGGALALHGAALDDRIAGVASFCGFTPMRSDTDNGPAGGLRRFWEWHALLPKLGVFRGHESDVPYDYDDLLTAIAPRPTLIYSARNDRDADPEAVARCVAAVRHPALTWIERDDVNRFQSVQQQIALDWLKGLASRP